MKQLCALFIVLALPFKAEASRPQRIDRVITGLTCMGANGLIVRLKTPGTSAQVVASLGLSNRPFDAFLERDFSGQMNLALDASGVTYKVPANIDLESNAEQSFSGLMKKYINLPVVIPVTFATCKITLDQEPQE